MCMSHGESLQEILIMLSAAVAIVAIFRQFNLSPVLGFLFAGAAIGPTGLELVGNLKEKSYIAEYGVVFLLFTIGLELSFKRLREMRVYVLGLGAAQVLITTGIIGYLAFLYLDNWKVALIIGGSFAMSSTAVVLQVLSERGERLSQVGRVSFAVLLAQDLAVIPLLVMLPILATGNGDISEQLGISFAYAIAIVTLMLLAGRFLLKPVLSVIASASRRNSELFVATTLLLVLGAAHATEHFGLSLAFGAFIAGLMIAETEYRKQVEVDINPFKGLLMGLFFMTIGMSFDLNELINRLPEVVLYSALLLAIKSLVIISLCRAFQLSWQSSIRSGLLLAQGSEFSFVLFGLALEKDMLSSGVGQLLLIVVSFSMAITPLVYSLIVYLFSKRKKSSDIAITETEDLDGHFVICGFGWVGENLAKLFSEEGINFVAVEQETKRVKAGRALGLPVFYGDATRPEILESLRVKKAKAVIVTIHDSKPVKRVVQSIRHRYKDAVIIARAKHKENMEAILKAGANIVVPEAYESAMLIARNALIVNGGSEKEISRAIAQFMSDRLDELNKN